jgi:hypothetical protein
MENINTLSKAHMSFKIKDIECVRGKVVTSKVPEYKKGNLDWWYISLKGVYIGRVHESKLHESILSNIDKPKY